MIRVVLAEKPSQAREYGKALGKSENKGGVIIVKDSPCVDGEIHIVAARGHLFEYQNPKENWDFNNLPLSDSNLELSLKDDEDIKKRFSIIKNEVKKAGEVIIGTDADREGERIAYTILSKIPDGLNKATKRLWINSMTTEAIQNSFRNLKNAKETKNLYHEADARSISDWIVGMNLTQLTTLDLQRKKIIPNKKGNVMSVGRVQTPTVRLICENDQAIKNFVPEKYSKIVLQDQNSDINFSNEEKYFERTEALKLIEKSSDIAEIIDIVQETKEKKPPKLFSLTTLQAYGSKHWKKSADEILKICQSLYDKKFLTYPRTDSNFITHFEFEYLFDNVEKYQKVLGKEFEIVNIKPRKNYVNDKKVQEHFAIIPTEQVPDLTTLSEDEQLVYLTVTLRSILMFAGNYKYYSTVVTAKHDDLEYKSSGNQLKDLGYKKILESKIKEDIVLPHYQKGQQIKVSVLEKEDVTKPPKRITEEVLLAKIFPKFQLGTPATRATIIETIQKRKYVKKDKKTGQFTPTKRGYQLINYLKDSMFSDPKVTSGWEILLKKVGEGSLPKEHFVSGIRQKVTEQIEQIKNSK
jgi:DNA topoisomerase-3